MFRIAKLFSAEAGFSRMLNTVLSMPVKSARSAPKPENRPDKKDSILLCIPSSKIDFLGRGRDGLYAKAQVGNSFVEVMFEALKQATVCTVGHRMDELLS